VAGGASVGSDEWKTAVAFETDEALAEELRGRLPPPGSPRAVPVTDLVAPRRAFWRALAAVEITPERAERFNIGRDVHRRLGAALRGDGPLEVRVRRAGLVGRIDLLADVPVEVKTTRAPVPPELVVRERPEQVEQLAMYVALASRSEGRLLSVSVEGDHPTAVQAVDIAFGPPASAIDEMEHRAAGLRVAWSRRDPSGLPRCRWFARGCEFREANVCGCTGAEPEAPSPFLEAAHDVRGRPDVGGRIEATLAALPREAPAAFERYREMIYLRRTYFDRRASRPRPEPMAREPGGATDLYDRLRAAAESGSVGDVARLPSEEGWPEEEVAGFRGVPLLLRSSRAWEVPTPTSLLAAQPQYALELGLRCAATGTTSGLLLIGRERATSERESVLAFRVSMRATEPFRRFARERAARLEAASSTGEPRTLPPCPGWMQARCPYAPGCGCAEDAGRSQR
jgi:hypothetical protein